jgi:hypothetical protein
MSLKLRIKFGDIIKLLFGGSIYVKDTYNGSNIRITKGQDTYITKF